jgi:hypothetical protein
MEWLIILGFLFAPNLTMIVCFLIAIKIFFRDWNDKDY